MTAWIIRRALTRDDDSLDRQAVRERIRYEMTTHRISLLRAKVRVREAINGERSHVAHLQSCNRHFEEQERLLTERARLECERWGYDLDRLRFERDRWHYGNSTKRADMLPVVERALKLARERAATLQAAE